MSDTSTILSILVVDHEKNYRIILSRLLEGAGYRVLTAEHPLVAIDQLRQQPVALILADLAGPAKDGLEFCRRVADDIGSIPFILFSAFIPACDRREIDTAVATWKCMSKPFDNQAMLTLVDELLCGAGSQDVSTKSYVAVEVQENS